MYQPTSLHGVQCPAGQSRLKYNKGESCERPLSMHLLFACLFDFRLHVFDCVFDSAQGVDWPRGLINKVSKLPPHCHQPLPQTTSESYSRRKAPKCAQPGSIHSASDAHSPHCDSTTGTCICHSLSNAHRNVVGYATNLWSSELDTT